MKAQLEQIKINALAALDAAETPAALEELRVKLLGKKGELTAVLKQMGKLTPEEKQQMCLEYLRNHPGIKEKDALKALNIGRSTFYKLKKMM